MILRDWNEHQNKCEYSTVLHSASSKLLSFIAFGNCSIHSTRFSQKLLYKKIAFSYTETRINLLNKVD